MNLVLKIILQLLIVYNINGYALKPENREILDEVDIPELKYLNENVDPCDDFYQFSCGNFEKYNPLPHGQKMWDGYYILQKKIDDISAAILQSKKREDDPKAIKKVKDIYQSCVSYEKYDSYYQTRPMGKIITDLGGWPLIDSHYGTKKSFSWPEVGDLIANYGLPLFLSWSIKPFTTDANEFMIYLGKDVLALPSTAIIAPLEETSEDKFEEIFSRSQGEAKGEIPYVIYLTKIAITLCKELNCQIPYDKIKIGINDIMNVMREISQSPSYPSRSFSYNKTISTIDDLQEWSDSFSKNYITRINWLDFFKHTFQNSTAKLSKKTKVYVLNTTSVANILDLVEHTNKDVIRNFMFARLTTYMAPDSTRELWEAYNTLYKNTYGDRYPIYSRPDYCQKKAQQMSFALSYEYFTYHFNNDKLKNVKKLIKDLKETFTDLLDENSWIDKEGKKKSKKKLKKMAELIGFPDFIFSEKKLDKYYKSLTICRHDHFGNMQRLRAFNLAKSVDEVGHKRDRYAWSNSPMQVNAYYNPQNNRIVVPAAIMNPPFSSGQFSVLDYGRIGAIIGHEITHGFDSNGWNFNEEGSYGPIFSKNISEIFGEKSNCFQQQYSKYYVDEIKQYVDGRITLKENIADNGGIRESYRAFMKVLDRDQTQIFTQKYDSKQLFFIAYGTNWCKIDTLESLQIMAKNDHSPNRFRVKGPVSNMKEFSEAFHCPKGSKMNPETKCILW